MDSNTYLLANDTHRIALVVDTGAGSAQWVQNTLDQHDLTLGAVLLTHGHADHVWDASAVAAHTPVYIPQPDMYRLDDPLADFGLPNMALGFTRMGSSEWKKPEKLYAMPAQAFAESMEIVPGVWIRALATPGHTEGSCVFLFEGEISKSDDPHAISGTGHSETCMFAGDVIFAGSVGRTDLPGGDQDEMIASLRLLVSVIRPDVRIFPGHGSDTTMFQEIRYNEFIHAAMG